jgi:hypothetical protein
MKRLLDQIARSGLLWDDDTVTAIFAGDTPPPENVVTDLVIGVMDCDAVIRNDPSSTWVSITRTPLAKPLHPAHGETWIGEPMSDQLRHGPRPSGVAATRRAAESSILRCA